MKNWVGIICLALTTLSSASDTSSQTSEKPAIISVAVLDLEPRGGLSTDEILAISDRFRAELLATDHCEVIERSQMSQILAEQGFQQVGICSDASCIVEAGQLLAVNKMIGGSIGKMGKAFSITIRMIDVQTGKIERQVSKDLKCTKEALISQHIRTVARQIVGLEKGAKSDSNKWIAWVVPTATIALGGGAFAAYYLINENSRKNETVYENVDITIPLKD